MLECPKCNAINYIIDKKKINNVVKRKNYSHGRGNNEKAIISYYCRICGNIW